MDDTSTEVPDDDDVDGHLRMTNEQLAEGRTPKEVLADAAKGDDDGDDTEGHRTSLHLIGVDLDVEERS